MTVGLRPDHFNGAGTAQLELDIEVIEHLGSQTYAYARHGDGELMTIAVEDGRSLKMADKLSARFQPSSALLFDAEGQRIR